MNDCPTKRELLTAWEAAATAYSDAVRQLATPLGKVSASDYDKLKQKSEHERQRSRAAQKAFAAHVKENSC